MDWTYLQICIKCAQNKKELGTINLRNFCSRGFGARIQMKNKTFWMLHFRQRNRDLPDKSFRFIQNWITIQSIHTLLIHGPISYRQHCALWIHLYHSRSLHWTIFRRCLSNSIEDTSAKHVVLPCTCPFTGNWIQYPQGSGNSS